MMRVCPKCGYYLGDKMVCQRCGCQIIDDGTELKGALSPEQEEKKRSAQENTQITAAQSDHHSRELADSSPEDREKGTASTGESGNPALIQCSACKNLISKEAVSCPHCGQPTPYARRLKEEEESRARQKAEATAETASIAVSGVIAIAFMVIGAILFFSALYTMSSDINGWGYYNYKSPLSDHEVGVIFRMVMGIAMVIGGFIDAMRIKAKSNK